MRYPLNVFALLASLVLAGPAAGQAPDTSAAPGNDPAATAFVNRCAGCHTLDGTRLTGPSLTHVAAWRDEERKTAISRMTKNVGPLASDEIDSLSAFLRAPDALARLKVQEERIRAQFALTLAPPNAVLGERLFRGQKPLENRGLACIGCHSIGGRGGSVGRDLTDAFVRLGEVPLRSGIENAAYPVMAAHFRRHPITRQEAAHLAKYLSTLDPAAPRRGAPNHLALGGGSALLLFVGLFFYYDRRRSTRRGVNSPGRG